MTDMVTIPQRLQKAVLPCTGHGVVLRRRETVLQGHETLGCDLKVIIFFFSTLLNLSKVFL